MWGDVIVGSTVGWLVGFFADVFFYMLLGLATFLVWRAGRLVQLSGGYNTLIMTGREGYVQYSTRVGSAGTVSGCEFLEYACVMWVMRNAEMA